jgi:hypothetical protein
MSNYLRGLGQAVGFTKEAAPWGSAEDQFDAEWDEVSRVSRGTFARLGTITLQLPPPGRTGSKHGKGGTISLG